MHNFLPDVEDNKLREGDKTQLNCMRWLALRLDVWGWALKHKYNL
jgi:hypothetical protein